MEHSLYSPGLAPSNFHFGLLKKHLGGKRFPDDAAIHNAVQKWFKHQKLDFTERRNLQTCARWDKPINLLSKREDIKKILKSNSYHYIYILTL